MTTTLYLTTAEQSIFNQFPAAVRTGWNIETEVLDAYETPKQLQVRAFMSDFTAYPDLALLIKRLVNEPEKVTMSDFEELNPDIQQEVYFIMGARGVNTIVQNLLQEEVEDDLMYALSTTTTIRHKLLQLNSHQKS